MAASDLTTLAAVKAQLGLKINDDDDLLGRLITAASDFLRVYCDADIFPETTYTDYWRGNGISETVVLVHRPVQSVASVVLEQQGTVPAYSAATRRGWQRNSPKGNVLRLRGYAPGEGELCTVTYSANFQTVPSEIGLAITDMVARAYRERSRIGEASKSVGGEVISFTVKDVGDARTLVMLEHYRRRIPYTGGGFP